jgi:hypothetical protein
MHASHLTYGATYVKLLPRLSGLDGIHVTCRRLDHEKIRVGLRRIADSAGLRPGPGLCFGCYLDIRPSTLSSLVTRQSRRSSTKADHISPRLTAAITRHMPPRKFSRRGDPHAACLMPHAVCLTPYALCLMPYASRRMPYALCRMPYASRRMPHAVSRRLVFKIAHSYADNTVVSPRW